MEALPGLGRPRTAAVAVRQVVERWALAVSIGLSTVFFLLANCAGLSNPGLEYDELLFVNGALGATHPYQGFIYREFDGIPTMLMAYIGALKAWIYYPIFAIFGVSVDSIRLPAVLMATAVLLLATLLVYRLFGRWPAALLAILVATDPAWGALARTDWGPIVLSAFFRVGALLCYFAFLRRGSVRYLWLLAAALSLGLYNKLDYLWFIVAFCVAALAVHHAELWAQLRRRPKAVLAPIVTFAAIAIAAFFVLVLPADRLPLPGSHASLGGRISEVVRLFRGTFNGSAVYDNMTGSLLRHATLMGWLIPWILLASAGVAVWYFVWGRRRASDDVLRGAAASTAFFLLVFIVIAIGIVVTRQATGAWHVMLLWPLPGLLTLSVLVTLSRVPARRWRRVGITAVAVALVALAFTQVRTTVAYVDAYRSSREWGPFWSTEIYAADREISRSAGQVESIITADWGLGTQIFALGSEAVRDRFSDPWPSFTSPGATTAELDQNWFRGKRVIIVFHTRSAEILPYGTERVEAILRSPGVHVRKVFAGRQIEADEVLP